MRTPGLLRASVRAGWVGGIAVIYLGLVGMIQALNGRNVVGSQVTVGRMILVIPPLVAAYVGTRPRVMSGEERRADLRDGSLAGALAGFLTGAITAAGIAIVNLLGVDTVGRVFKSVNGELLDILSFGRSSAAGAVILMVGGGVFGAAAGALRATETKVRRPIVVGVLAVVVMGMLQRIVPTALKQAGLSSAWLYSPVTLGLTWFGAAVSFVVGAGVAVLLRDERRRSMRTGVERVTGGEKQARVLGLVVVVLILLSLPYVAGTIMSQIMGTVGIYILMGIGLNIVVGYAGLLDLGYVAFFAVGAYMTALLTGGLLITTLGLDAPAFSLHLSFFIAVPLVVCIAAFVGVLIGAPVLRLRGDYLAIVTLGFGEIARALFSSDWLKSVFGGTQGITKVPAAPLAGFLFREPRHFYFLVLFFCLIAAFVSWRLQDSRTGRAWNAMREDEQVAEAVGVSSTKYKLLAFAIGGAVGSLGGALFAVQIGSLNDASFTILVSITTLAVVILGGMGSIPGVIVGALVLIGIPGLFSEFEAYQLLIYGAVLMGVMILRPQGLIPNVRRSRELLEEDVAQDKWGGDVAADEGVASDPSPIGEGSG
jgi:branched-chain amino acid transport system permease protein